ncbi:exodeoxyribonuclease VII small subunit [Candidatus Saccharibacteria bacterium]|nr:exodeoxyribonuclease VII small subunit [Candidatus Saccharibacteria bacterium]
MSTKKDTGANFNFSDSLKELEEITDYLESSEVDLARAIARFERGTELAKELKSYLQTAKNRVATLKQNFEK